jgi:hypothetical protein
MLEWFKTKEQGIYMMKFAMKRHPALSGMIVRCIGNFTGSGDNMCWAYLTGL